MTYTLAVVGLDGAGKSTVVNELVRRRSDIDFRMLRFPALHEQRNVPFADLSQDLATLSSIADQVGSGEAKASALYLLTSLFGPSVRFLTEAYRPRTLLLDRHVLVDVMAYLPVYEHLMKRSLPLADKLAEIGERLDATRPGAMTAIDAWCRIESARLGEDCSLLACPGRLRRLLALAPAAQVQRIERECRTTAPNAIVLLDVSPEVAAARAKERPKSNHEMHEQLQSLVMLREAYRAALERLRAQRPTVEVKTLRVDAEEPLVTTVQRFLDLFGGELPADAFVDAN